MLSSDVLKLISVFLAIGINSTVIGIFVGKLSAKVEANEKRMKEFKICIDESIRKSEEKNTMTFTSKQDLVNSAIDNINKTLTKQEETMEKMAESLVKIQLEKVCR